MDYRNDLSLPLGIRNNNPGNMRPGQNWEGEVGENAGFSVFSDVSYGIRAWLVSFHTAIAVHGRNTLEKYVTAYAPPSENNTAAYIVKMSDSTGIAATDVMPTDQESVKGIMRAQFKVEDGASEDKLSDLDIEAGFQAVPVSLRAFFLSPA